MFKNRPHSFDEHKRYMRMREIAEQAISYLQDNGLIDDFLEDRDIDLSPEEKRYFAISEGGDE